MKSTNKRKTFSDPDDGSFEYWLERSDLNIDSHQKQYCFLGIELFRLNILTENERFTDGHTKSRDKILKNEVMDWVKTKLNGKN